MAEARILRTLSVMCAMCMVLSGFSMFAMAKKDDEKVRCIVLFNDKVDKTLVEDNNGEILDTFDNIPAVVTELTKGDMKELKKSDKVSAVEEDGQAEAIGGGKEEGKAGGGGGVKPPAQVVPWGIQKIQADIAWNHSTGTTIKVAVMDTGIDVDHPDLKAQIKGGTNVINSRQSYDDDNGHGTHCAGIIGAIDNTEGVKGVAPAVSLYAIKVLNKSGSGSYTNFINGLSWAKTNKMDVVSMSFGGTSYSLAFEKACIDAAAAGIVLVAAAGNYNSALGQSSAVMYPAAFSSVIAVAATDGSNARASFSCYGPQVDLAAPGVSIYSTYKGGGYTTMSGTSMACPHVSGTVALARTMAVPSLYDLDDDDSWDPSEVESWLEATATDLGNTDYYGSGLVNAHLAAGG